MTPAELARLDVPDAELIEQLEKYPDFWLNGAAWMRSAKPAPLTVLAAKRLREMAAEIAAPVEPDDERANPTWDLVIAACSEAWPDEPKLFYDQSPTELITRLINERDELKAKLSAPELHDFAQAVVLEAAHQRERWGNEHDEGKTAEDWMWLVAYLSTKATQAARYGDAEKYLHHIITCAAACNNWHASASGANNEMRAGAHVSITELDAARAASEGNEGKGSNGEG